MRALDYALREGWKGLRRSGSAGAVAMLATGLAIFVLGSLLLLTTNVQRIIEQWTSTAEFSVFLRDDATSEERGAIEQAIDASGISAGRSYVSKADALARFKREFTDLTTLAAGLDDNPFPASIEVQVRPEAEGDEGTASVVQRMAAMPGVADVRYDTEWLATVNAALGGVRTAGWALGVLVALAAAATVTSVVRLGLQSRTQEIEIMQLVGSPLAFIRGPFVAEGLYQGGFGAIGAITVLWVVWLAAIRWWGPALAAALDGVNLRFLSPLLVVALVLGGMAVGALGGFMASRHAR